MKEYKATKAFSSPRLGNVKAGDKVTLEGSLGDQIADAGYLEPTETKPAPKAETKETKPAKPATKKATKKD